MGIETFLPTVTNRIGSLSLDNAMRAYKKAPNPASGVGAFTREALVSPASYAMESMVNAGAPARSAIGDFLSGLTDSGAPSPATAPAAAAAARPVVATPAAAVAAPAPPAAEGEVLGPDGTTPRVTRYSVRPPAPVTNVDYVGPQTNAVSGLFASGAALRQAGALNRIQNQSFNTQVKAASTQEALNRGEQQQAAGDVALEGATLDLNAKREESALREAAAQGDEKALAKLRNLTAARAGKSPEEAVNEKLLDAYLKSVAEFNKDPSNLGKQAPSFTDFAGGLPPGMFPNISKYATALPQGMKRSVGTSNGKPVYEGADGKRYIAP